MGKRGAFNLIPAGIGLVVIVGMMIRGCEDGPFGRSRVVGLSPAEEKKLGAQAFHEVLAKERVLSPGDPFSEKVRHIGLRLAKASDNAEVRKMVGYKDMNFEWEFRVVHSKQVNAFCLPGGKVVVYTGILPVCATDAGLATVMGHEIAHALARHGSERVAQQQMVAVGQTAVAMSMGDMDPGQRATLIALLGAGTSVGVLLPFSRKHESEADRLGLLLMAAAGYDPAEAPEFWQRMEQASGGGRTAEFLSTHPNPATRVKDLRDWQTEAEPFYRKSERQRSLALPGLDRLSLPKR